MVDSLVRNDGRFKPGTSGNPAGRAPGFARLVREKTKEGTKVVDFFLGLLDDGQASNKDKIEAGKILLAYGYGKPPEVSLTLSAGAESSPFATLAPEALTTLARTLATPALVEGSAQAPLEALQEQVVSEPVTDTKSVAPAEPKPKRKP